LQHKVFSLKLADGRTCTGEVKRLRQNHASSYHLEYFRIRKLQ
jgi:hypothetical protein